MSEVMQVRLRIIIIDFIGKINTNSHKTCERDSSSFSNMVNIVDTLMKQLAIVEPERNKSDALGCE